MSIGSAIATLGQNPNFIAFNAHWGFAFFVVTIAERLYSHLLPIGCIALALAAVKEFWFDPRYEINQSVWPDGALDFAGYAAGVVLAVVL